MQFRKNLVDLLASLKFVSSKIIFSLLPSSLKSIVKYFFLSEGWIFDRVWEFGGLWNENAWRRKPEIKQLNIGIVEQGETLWLYQVEDAVLMVEVKPDSKTAHSAQTIGNVVLKRLITAEQVIYVLIEAEAILNQFAQS